MGVSIHARHCWRANPGVQWFAAMCVMCFNPRPPLLAGESGHHRTKGNGLTVSIHARHCWRANPDHLGQRPSHKLVSIHARHCWRANPGKLLLQGARRSVSIHARHCWRANPTRCGYMLPASACFNPRPPLLAGESPESPKTEGKPVCFNPRPPLLAGESAVFLCL